MEKILISKSISDFIRIPEDQLERVIITPEINEEIRRLIAEKQSDILRAVLFIHYYDYEGIYQFLNEFDHTTTIYKIIVIDPDNIYSFSNIEKLKNISDIRTSQLTEKDFTFIVYRSFEQIEEFYRHKTKIDNFNMQLIDTEQDQEDLINIGKSLSLEKDMDKLLRSILTLSKRITGADAGSIYLVEDLENKKKQLRFKYSHTFSKDIPLEEFVIPYDKKSMAGYVAVTGKVLNIHDVYKLSKDDPVSHNPSFDEENDYRTKSMLTVPMRNHIDEIIGVIQLLNSKEDSDGNKGVTGNEAFEILLEKPEDFEKKVVPFAERYERLMEAVASQAAIAIENNRMIKQIEQQFEEFVKASVTAIESRDIATSGHSFRIAEICKEMAMAINKERTGVFKDISFSETEIKELEFASLLHDFGKVYIDISIFMKGKKLFPKDFDNVMLKFNYLYKLIELNYYMDKIKLLESNRDAANQSRIDEINRKKDERLKSIKKLIEEIQLLNEPTVTEVDPDEVINEISCEVGDIVCCDIEGNKIEVLTEDEKMNLEIKRGSLNPIERAEIESHVMHTYNFVSKIPWPPEYKNIPEIALKHHEKLDGTGYPHGLKGDEIPIQARMMAIADVYDALIATDRPYKKAIPLEKALDILREEAERNKLDKDLLDIFLRYKIYKKIDKDSFRAVK
jgi:HD-GYP domain-containing protein (c-di-GMP phosphodiesterase class II)